MVKFGKSHFNRPRAMTRPSDSTVEDAAKDFTGEAIVDEEIQPHRKGRVNWRGSYWPARCELDITLVPEEIVEVVGLENITLLVMPISKQ